MSSCLGHVAARWPVQRLSQATAHFPYPLFFFIMKTTFSTPARQRNFLVFCRFSGLRESGQGIGQGTLAGNQRFARVQ
ncbi:hypothetical protein A0257_13405 [Hymenobacter psoromatis]|nr:hypothetical protein A0257_13405 [Hymenobacter psoromatis]